MTSLEVIRIRGRDQLVPSVEIEGRRTIVTGSWLRIAEVKDEELVEGEVVADPARFIARLKRSGIGADIFTFAERPPRTAARYDYERVWDNWAVVRVGKFETWWKGVPQESRKNVRRAERRGVVVRVVEFDDDFIAGMTRIYSETEVRQGRRFWHFGKDVASIRRMNETYLDRSVFIGAFVGEELIGFIKMVFVDDIAELMQILAMNRHQDKRPMNALLAHAVKLCEERGMSLLVYGKYSYGSKGKESLVEFKRRNGFEEVRFPRYYVPLTLKGRVAIRYGLQAGIASVLPERATRLLLRVRSRFYQTWNPSTASQGVEAE